MEEHLPAEPADEQTEPSDDPWRRVGDEFSTLGASFKSHFKRSQQTGSDNLIDSLKAAFDSLGDAAKDEQVRSDAKSAGASFMEAIGDTFSELGETLRKKAEDARRTGDAVESADAGDPIDEAHSD